MNYTNEQKDLISSLIGTRILPRTHSETLKASLVTAHGHMYSDCMTASDLLLLSSAIELLVTPGPEDESKEEYSRLIQALTVTRAMLKEAEARKDTDQYHRLSRVQGHANPRSPEDSGGFYIFGIPSGYSSVLGSK